MAHEQRDVFTCDACNAEHHASASLPRDVISVQAIKGDTNQVLTMHLCAATCAKKVTVADVIEKGSA